MFGIFDKIEEFFKELLLGGIQANLESMFFDINDKVGAVATDVGKTPMGWNGIDRIRLHNKVEELEERTDDIGRCHNDFCLMQQRYNKNTDEQLAIIQDEIGSVYEHFEEPTKSKEDGR